MLQENAEHCWILRAGTNCSSLLSNHQWVTMLRLLFSLFPPLMCFCRYSQNILLLRERVDDTQRQVACLEVEPQQADPVREEQVRELQGQLETLRAKMHRMEKLEKSFSETKRQLEVGFLWRMNPCPLKIQIAVVIYRTLWPKSCLFTSRPHAHRDWTFTETGYGNKMPRNCRRLCLRMSDFLHRSVVQHLQGRLCVCVNNNTFPFPL